MDHETYVRLQARNPQAILVQSPISDIATPNLQSLMQKFPLFIIENPSSNGSDDKLYTNMFGRPLKQRLPMLHDRLAIIYEQTKDRLKQLVFACLHAQKLG